MNCKNTDFYSLNKELIIKRILKNELVFKLLSSMNK